MEDNTTTPIIGKHNEDTKKEGQEQPETSISLGDLVKDMKRLEETNTAQRTDKNSNPNNSISFPVSAFPAKVEQIVNEFHKAYQLPVDYYGLGILVACGAVIGNAYNLEYKNGYCLPPIIYGAIVGSSSIGKTPALKLCLNPISKIEEQYEKDYKDAILRWEQECEGMKKKDLPPKPHRKDLLINDATTEAIHNVLSRNPKGLVLFQDELIAWINNLNQYRKGSDVEFWLSNWSNSGAKINRATKDPLFIPKPSVSVLGGLQPSVLDDLASNGKKDNGFLFRILFAFPEQQRKPYESGYCPPSEIFHSYYNLINGLHNLPNLIVKDQSGSWEIEPVTVLLSEEGKTRFNKWNRTNTDAINETFNDNMKSLFGKMEQYCLRFALILELMEFVCNGSGGEYNGSIEADQIENAIALTEYFRSMGIKVLNRIEKVNPLEEYTKDKQELYDALPESFTTAQGVEIAVFKNFPERSFKRFLKDKTLFGKIKRGEYEKLL